MEKKKKIIGIIGGAGVAATNKLSDLIENKLTLNGAFRDSHQPELIIYQAVNVPSRSMFIEGKGESFIPGYIEISQKLKLAGAEILAMCCNTAHYAIDDIQEAVQLPFIDLIEEVVKKAKTTGYKKFGLLASNGCLKGKIYEKYFSKIFPDAMLIYPDALMQEKVTQGICNIKNKNRFLPDFNPERPKTIFEEITRDLKSLGAESVILGCTDIRVDFSPVTMIDSLEILADAIIEQSLIKTT